MHGIEISLGSELLTKEENPVEGCKVVWAIIRGLQVLRGHTVPLTLDRQHRGTLKTTRTDSHPIAPHLGVLQNHACCLHTKETQK